MERILTIIFAIFIGVPVILLFLGISIRALINIWGPLIN